MCQAVCGYGSRLQHLDVMRHNVVVWPHEHLSIITVGMIVREVPLHNFHQNF